MDLQPRSESTQSWGLRLQERPESLTFKVQTKKLQADLTLHRTAKPSALPRYPKKKGNDFFHVDILVPWAKVTGSVASPVQTKAVKGYGYIDHSRSNCLVPNIANRWVRFRGLDPKNPYLFQFHFPPGQQTITGWHWEAHANRPTALQRPKLQGGHTCATHRTTVSQRHNHGAFENLETASPLPSRGRLRALGQARQTVDWRPHHHHLPRHRDS